MKLTTHPFRRRAFTIVEIMVTLVIFSLVVIAMVSSQLFGLRVNKAVSAKMIATADARHAMDQVRDRIRNANTVIVGNSNGTNFLSITNGTQAGNAVQVFPSTNSALYYLFYVNTNANQLMVYFGGSSTTNGIYRSLAGNVTNRIVFDAEDFQGNILTNNQNNRVIRMTLDFLQFEYASGQRGNAYNHYQVQMRATQRLLN